VSIIEKAVSVLSGTPEPEPLPPTKPPAETRQQTVPLPQVAEAESTVSPTVSRFERSFALDVDAATSLTGTRPPWKASKRRRNVAINLSRLGATGLLVPGNKNPVTHAEFLKIREQLLGSIDAEATDSQNSNVIVVTSALPKEGKTFTALGLASSISMDTGRTVLLIDADVMKGGASKLFGITTGEGFSDLLADPAVDISDTLFRTSIDNFAFMPCGRKRINLTELFSSDRMDQLVSDLSLRYSDRIIIIDGPALLSFSSAPVLASRAGHVLMIVEAQRTPRKAIEQGLGLLDACGHVGLVLNRYGHTSVQAA
jgi:exopolysaccharide/PEP-CTERM locus tyrosine autokinase